MSVERLRVFFALTAATILAAVFSPGVATAQPSATEIQKYLVIAMGNEGDVGKSVQTSCTELGADRIVLSTTTSTKWTPLNGCLPNLVNVFGMGRWNTATNPDSVNGAAALFQGIDCSGNVALTSATNSFDAANSLFFTELGFGSGRTSGSPIGSVSNTSHYFEQANNNCLAEAAWAPNPNPIAFPGNGVSINNNYTTLLNQLAGWKTFINGFGVTDVTITSLAAPFDFTDNLASNGNGGLRTTFLDTNLDGLIVVDFNVSGDFSLTNLDWVIDSGGTAVNGPLIVFRIRNGSNMTMQNTSILMHSSDLTATEPVGAIFYHASESSGSGDTVFTVGNNTVLNGVALWDLNAVGAGGSTKTNININNGQGCSQFVSQKVNFQNSRWVRCAPGGAIQARISIDPDEVNRVGENHTFTVLVELDTGQGFAPVDVSTVNATLTNANGALATLVAPGNTCANGTGDAADSEGVGQCFVTFKSNTTGTVTGNASATVTLGALNLPVSTDPTSPNFHSPTGPAVKRYVDARIAIDPDDVNRVGDPHTFFVQVQADLGDGNGFVNVNDEAVTVSLTNNGAVATLVAPGNTCTNGTGNDPAGPGGVPPAEGVGQCSVTFTSSSPGTVTGNASATVNLATTPNPINLPVSTADANSPTGSAIKRFVNARISIDPDEVNRVGENHTFNVLVQADSGSGLAAVNVDAVTVVLTNANGAVATLVAPGDTCANGTGDAADSEGVGQCSVTFKSDTTGTVTGNASATVALSTPQGPINVLVSTDPTSPNFSSPTGPAVKRYVDARISIDPDDVNRVSDPHTFLVQIQADFGDGNDFVNVNDESVTVSLTNNGAVASLVSPGDLCAGGTGNDPAGPGGVPPAEGVGQCSVTFTSNSPGTVTGNASAIVTLNTTPNNVNLSVSTADANSPTGSAIKRFVDARISIDPDDVNGIGEPHTFTVLVEANSGSGWAAVNVDVVTVVLTDSGGAVSSSVAPGDTCANGTGDAADSEATGECSVSFTSNTTGSVTGSASATVALVTDQGNINLPVSTTDANSPTGNSVKRFVDGSLAWQKVDENDEFLFGATFEVCRTHDRHGNDIDPDECVTVLDNSAADQDSDDGQFLLIDLELGRYTIEETIAPAGYSLIAHVEVVFIGGSGFVGPDVPPDENLLDIAVDYVWVNGRGVCLVIIDEDTLDNGISTVQAAAAGHLVKPDWLVNDNDPIKGVPTEHGNPPLNWNDFFAGDVVLLPGGQVDDEGWFALPPEIVYEPPDLHEFPFNDLDGNVIANSDDWIAAFANGTLPQDKLDKVRDVMPLRNQDLVQLVGKTCVAVVYDSDISMNYEQIYANLQGARYGLFSFTVRAVEVPGSLPESASNTDLYDLWLQIEEPLAWSQLFEVTVRDHEPDAIEITCAAYDAGLLTVWGTSDFAPGAVMTVSVDETDSPKSPAVDPFLLEETMTYNAGEDRYEFEHLTGVDLVGRRVTISTDEGGAYTVVISAGSCE